jgi:hypothetical protein
MAEYSRIAKGSFTSTGAAKFVSLPFQPDAVEIWNYTAAATPAQNGVPYAYWDVAMGQGYALANYFNATPVLSSGAITANGFSTFAAGQLLQFGPKQQIIGATAADPIVVNVTAHGYAVGDIVMLEGLYQTANTAGMPQIAGMQFVVTVVGDADHFSIKWNGAQSAYTALSGSPAGSYVYKVLYPFLYEPNVSFIEAVTRGSTTTVVTTAPHNLVVGQQVAFRIPSQWGIVELNSLPNVLTPGAPAYGYVVSVTDARTVVININSSAYTAYNSNVLVSAVVGLTPPQMVPVGDVNTGGEPISSGSLLYPAPKFLREDGSYSSTINGPAIKGAFVNNTKQGFIVGAGSLTGLTSTHLVGANNDVLYYRAYLSDYVNL